MMTEMMEIMNPAIPAMSNKVFQTIEVSTYQEHSAVPLWHVCKWLPEKYCDWEMPNGLSQQNWLLCW